MTTKRILSIDGGGIRGIIPALVLEYIEQKTGKPIASMFDMIAGTSTGGILALGLAKPNRDGVPAMTASYMAELYSKRGREVFPRNTWRRVITMGGLRDELYPATGLEEVLRDYLGGAKLSESLCDILIPAYDIERRDPFFFKSRRAKETADYDFWMSQVARATSAAPTYFEPAIVKNMPENYTAYLVDGGVFANNPAQCALAEAKLLYPDTKDFFLLSLGTGQLTRPVMYDEAKNWGKVGWVRPLIDILIDGVSDTVDYQLRQLMPQRGTKSRYIRLQTELNEGSDDMDDASATNIRALRYKAEDIIKQNQRLLKGICRMLSQ